MAEYSPMPVRIRTPRLALRPWELADVGDYQALVTERGNGTPTDEDARDRITSLLATSAETGFGPLVVRRRAEGDFLGYCGLIVGRADVDEPEIAFELHRSVHDHGYATEAAGAIVRAAAETGRRRLWATVGAWNAPSLRVLDKLGFERDRVTDEAAGEVVWLRRALT